MTNDQINLAIAKLCGVEVQPEDMFGFQGFSRIPDYCNDYKAIMDAMTLVVERGLESVYLSFLYDYVHPSDTWTIHLVTVRFRAEMILKTLGKWEE